MFVDFRLALIIATAVGSAVASTPTVAFDSIDQPIPTCWEGNIGEYAIATEVLNGQTVQITVVCDGTDWVPATYHTLPQVENEGID